ncbi:hypothetical protein KAX03_00590 [Candidatus Bathyarchaeota archaeon]|nr:hypothetical protein [Candidatus Bathyarchaeota archaeon]
MTEDKSTLSGIIYECVKCGAQISYDKLVIMPEIKCHECGYRILKKIRPPIVKRIKAI